MRDVMKHPWVDGDLVIAKVGMTIEERDCSGWRAKG